MPRDCNDLFIISHIYGLHWLFTSPVGIKRGKYSIKNTKVEYPVNIFGWKNEEKKDEALGFRRSRRR